MGDQNVSIAIHLMQCVLYASKQIYQLKVWAKHVLTAGYLINRSPFPLFDDKTLYELFHEKDPPYSYLRIFCCLGRVFSWDIHMERKVASFMIIRVENFVIS